MPPLGQALSQPPNVLVATKHLHVSQTQLANSPHPPCSQGRSSPSSWATATTATGSASPTGPSQGTGSGLGSLTPWQWS